MNLETGMLVKSKAGRDKNHIYVVISVEREYVYVADGEVRPLRRMKRKNGKHLQPIRKVRLSGTPDDASVREIISNYIPDGNAANESRGE